MGICKIKLSQLKSSYIQDYYNSLMKDKLKSTSMKSCLTLALKDGYIMKNYCTYVILPKDKTKSKKSTINAFSLDEQKKFMAAAKNDKKGALYLFALGTGLRIGEILALKWDDVDLDNKVVKVSKTLKETFLFDEDEKRHFVVLEMPPKTPSSIREVPINDKLADIMRGYKSNQDKQRMKIADIYSDANIVFATPEGMYLDSSNVRKSFKRLLKRSDISEEFRLHDLRHTFATRLFEKNVAPKTVQTFMGHSTIETTLNIYTHVMKETKLEAIDTLNDIFNI